MMITQKIEEHSKKLYKFYLQYYNPDLWLH